MACHLFRHLRRCRALFALALCAWLALASVAWAMPADDCCAGAAAMHLAHAPDAHDHDAAHPAATDGCCAHASVTVPASGASRVLPVAAATQHGRAGREAPPQPVYDPPLRPPVA